MAKRNLPHEEIKGFEIYNGRNTEQMPKLIADGRVPMNIFQLMQRKLGLINDDSSVKDFFMDNYFDTGDLKAQRGDEVKLVLTTYADGSITDLGRKYLELINPEEVLVNRAVNLGIEERYDNLQGNGVVVTRADKLAKALCTPLSQEDVKDSLFWKVMLRHSDEVPKEFTVPGLHEEVIPYIFSEYQRRFAKDEKIDNLNLMGVYLDSYKTSDSEMRAWCVSRLGRGSYASGGLALDDDDGRFVGIAPEALSQNFCRS